MGTMKQDRRMNAMTPDTVPVESAAKARSDDGVRNPTSFLDLPAEIRNTIYERVLRGLRRKPKKKQKPACTERVNSMYHFAYPKALFPEPTKDFKRAVTSAPKLARTCRQIRQELMPLFLTKLTRVARSWRLFVHNFDFAELLAILDALPVATQKEVIANVRFDIILTFSRVPISAERSELVKRWLVKSAQYTKAEAKWEPYYRMVKPLPGTRTLNVFNERLALRPQASTGIEWGLILKCYGQLHDKAHLITGQGPYRSVKRPMRKPMRNTPYILRAAFAEVSAEFREMLWCIGSGLFSLLAGMQPRQLTNRRRCQTRDMHEAIAGQNIRFDRMLRRWAKREGVLGYTGLI